MATSGDNAEQGSWEDLTSDGGVQKQLLVEGTGECPAPDSDVFCHYTGRLASTGEVFDSSRDRIQPFNFPIGRGVVIKGWDIGIASMKKGEKCILRCAPEYGYGDQGVESSIPPNSTLDFEIELLDWTPWKRVDSNDNLLKKIVKKGTGNQYDTPYINKLPQCIVSYVARFQDPKDGMSFSRADRIHVYPVENDFTEYPKGFYKAICDMNPGERSIFHLKGEMLEGFEKLFKQNLGADLKDVVTAESEVYYDITLHSFEDPPWLQTLKSEKKIEKGLFYKKLGNDAFSLKRYLKALAFYRKGLEFLEADMNFCDSDEDSCSEEVCRKDLRTRVSKMELQAQEYKMQCWNNMAMIYLNLNKFTDCVGYCEKVLEVNDKNIKAMTRRAIANMKMGNLKEAKSDLKSAQKLEPKDDYIAKNLKQVNKMIKQTKEKEKKLYSKMFK